MNLKMTNAKQKIATLWFSGSGVLFFLVFSQTAMGRYGQRAGEVWAFLLPTIMPTLSLVIGVLVMDQLGKGVKTEWVTRFLYRLTIGISSAYLLAVGMVFIFQLISPVSPFDLMSQASIFLGPFQGLVAAALGAFFVVAPDAEDHGMTVDGPGRNYPANPPRT
jgi:hypothetical protein